LEHVATPLEADEGDETQQPGEHALNDPSVLSKSLA
jgi:hypothetical protein